MSNFSLNTRYISDEFIKNFSSKYSLRDGIDWSADGCSLVSHPYPCASFSDFIQLGKSSKDFGCCQKLVDAVETEIHKLPFKRNTNDLYSFRQSTDIVNLSSCDTVNLNLLKELRSFMLSDVLPWLKKITGAPLFDGKVDFTASMYSKTDVLLCHDDELEGRRIAFIWYLVPDDWDAAIDGGCLELIECRNFGQQQSQKSAHVCPLKEQPIPCKVCVSIPPQRNMFAFFEVSALSFHQVAEILGDKARISLHGWFHGPPLPRPPAGSQPSTAPPLISPVHIEEELIYSWLNPIYLDMSQQAKIRRKFKRSSEIQLAHFLQVEKWILLARVLAFLPQAAWRLEGPINRKHYSILTKDTADQNEDGPDLVRQVQRLFSSEAMQVILTDLTGVKLHSIPDPQLDAPAEAEPPPAKRANLDGGSGEPSRPVDTGADSAPQQHLSEPQLRRWQPGDYILLADTDMSSESRWRLEAVLHVTGYGPQEEADGTTEQHPGSGQWQSSWGGQIVYVAKDEPDELLTVHPKDNALTLVYTGPDTASFVKYINRTAKPLPPPPTPESAGDPTPAVACDLAVVFYEPRAAAESDDATDEDTDDQNGEDSEVASDANSTDGSLE